MEPFVYPSLTADNTFRLLKVSIGEDDRIQCLMEEHILSHDEQPKVPPPKYTALSYTWGDTSANVAIVCNGKELQITANLAAALRGTLHVNPHEYLWVDQICINQSDNKEKSAQVQRMARIYHVALTVLAWLGPERDDTALAVEWIEKVAGLTKGFGNDVFRDYENHEEREKIETREELSLERSIELGVDFSNAAAWAAFSAFYDWPWYKRIWVVQELLPAREARLVCGPHSVDWHAVKAAAAWYLFKAGRIRTTLDSTRAVDGVVLAYQMNLPWNIRYGSEFYPTMLNQTVRPTFRWDLPALLRHFSSRLATDARDKVYALIGISSVEKRAGRFPLLQPDYAKSDVDAFRDILLGYLQANLDYLNSNIDLLWNAALSSEQPGMPSWVPDWRQNPEYSDLAGSLPADTPAGRANRFIFRQPPHADNNSLVVEGLILGTVAQQSQWHCAADLSENMRASRDEFVHHYEQMFATRSYIHSADRSEDINTAFAMSLTAGSLWSGFHDKGTSEAVFADHLVGMTETLSMPHETDEEIICRLEKCKPYFDIGLGTQGNGWSRFLWRHYCRERWYITDTGYVGIGKYQMQPGDAVAILWGLNRACILRPLGSGPSEEYEGELLPQYAFVGEAYCRDGALAVQALPKDESGRSKGSLFVLR